MITADDKKQTLYAIAYYVRALLEYKYPDNKNLFGLCFEASELIATMLFAVGLNPCITDGWCICDKEKIAEHTWVECSEYYIDVTASQFNDYMFSELEDIYVVKEKPACMLYDFFAVNFCV